MRRAKHKPLRISYGTGAHNEGLGAEAGQFSKSKFLLCLLLKKDGSLCQSFRLKLLMNVMIWRLLIFFRVIMGWMSTLHLPWHIIMQ